MLETLKARAKDLKREAYALYIAAGDPRVPWYAKAFLGLVLAYAFSPIDLIPDFIPVLGYLDDLVLIPLGITLALRIDPGAGDDRRPAAGRRTAAAGYAGHSRWGGYHGRYLAGGNCSGGFLRV